MTLRNQLRELMRQGKAALQVGDMSTAARCFEQLTRLAPDSCDAWSGLGVVAFRLQHFERARRYYDRSLQIRPTDAGVLANLGALMAKLNAYEEAIEYCSRALESDSNHARATSTLAAVLVALGRSREAIDVLQRSLEINSDHPESHLNLASAFCDVQELDQAEQHARRAAQLAPRNAEAVAQVGSVLVERDMPERAEPWFTRALQLEPAAAGIASNLGMLRLRQGRWSEAWEFYEGRLQDPRSVEQRFMGLKPRWDGSPMPQGTVVVTHEQGLGDTLQFARYLPAVRARCGQLVLVCQPRLIPLLKSYPGVDQITDSLDQLTWDATIPLLSLPGALGANPQDIPPIQLEGPDEQLLKSWQARVRQRSPAKTIRVGICWAGSLHYPRDKLRSLNLEDLQLLLHNPLLHGRPVTWHSLQIGEQTAGLRTSAVADSIVDWSADASSVLDTAALIKQMDLIVTCDTFVAHLAGSLRAPTWTLLNRVCDWRWQRNTDQTPWYPSMRLFRQGAERGWSKVIGRVCDQLIRKLDAT